MRTLFKYNICMQKVLIICGPTATGKTRLALHLAKVLNGDLLVADSRQVYRGMSIVTGKDIPISFKLRISNLKLDKQKIGYWSGEDASIWLTDLVGLEEEFSVALWRRAAGKVMNRLQKDGRLPIVVGGTGLYIESMIKNLETIDIPPDKKLRRDMSNKTAEELYGTLARVDAIRAAGLNQSDRENPRRLLRAIEIALSERQKKRQKVDAEYLLIGLAATKEVLFNKIADRVGERLNNGALSEVKNLLARGVVWSCQSMNAIGYAELKCYFQKECNLEGAIESWKRAEQKYAMRQLTWFKRYREINWFDVVSSGWQDRVVKLARAWYNGDIKD